MSIVYRLRFICTAIIFMGLLVGCNIMQKKVFFYTKVDYDLAVKPNMKVYLNDIVVGEIKEIRINFEKREKRVKFFIYEDYYGDTAKEDSEILIKVNNSQGGIEKISISVNDKTQVVVPDGTVFSSRIIH